MKRVLIIGANSYIGRKLYIYQQNMHYNSINISLVSASDGEWKNIDFSSYDAVIHLAAIVHRKEHKKLETLYYEVNYKLAVDVALKAKSCHVKQFIFMSTAAVYDLNAVSITKDTIPNPSTLYGKSKLAAETDIIKLQDDNYRIAIIRLPMVYGEGCKGNYPKLILLAEHLPIFPEYHNKRSMIYIDTLCEFMVDLLSDEKSGYFYPQDINYVDTCDLVVSIRKSMGKRTLLTDKINGMIKFLIPRIKLINKMFGDFYYDL